MKIDENMSGLIVAKYTEQTRILKMFMCHIQTSI